MTFFGQSAEKMVDQCLKVTILSGSGGQVLLQRKREVKIWQTKLKRQNRELETVRKWSTKDSQSCRTCQDWPASGMCVLSSSFHSWVNIKLTRVSLSPCELRKGMLTGRLKARVF